MALSMVQREATLQVGQLYLRFGFPERAAALFAALTILEPREHGHLRALAMAHHMAGNPTQALAALDALALAGAIDGPFHSLRALVLGDLGRADESRAAMQAYMDSRDPVPALAPDGTRRGKTGSGGRP